MIISFIPDYVANKTEEGKRTGQIINGEMKNFNKTIVLTVVLAFTAVFCNAQTVTAIPDTTSLTMNSTQKTENMQDKNQNKVQDKNQGLQNNSNQQRAANRNNASGRSVKQVRSAKPDLSKARGARPNITRPSGSGVPKGVGKPGGAGKKGGS